MFLLFVQRTSNYTDAVVFFMLWLSWCWLFACLDSKVAEGSEGQIRSGPKGDEGWKRFDPEGAARERQEAAAGLWPPGGAGERQSPTDGGGASSAAAAGTAKERELVFVVKWVQKINGMKYNFCLLSCCCSPDCSRWIPIQTAGKRVPTL